MGMNEDRDLSRAGWLKSSFSNGQGGNCIEVARNLPGLVAIRDSKNPDGPVLRFSTDEWSRFIARLRSTA
jgi:hypothetical protein